MEKIYFGGIGAIRRTICWGICWAGAAEARAAASGFA
jgi:hypothetical protein